MNKKDEELLARLAKETENEGLDFDNHEPGLFHKVIERLMRTAPDKELKYCELLRT